jgi:hypothetical protein
MLCLEADEKVGEPAVQVALLLVAGSELALDAQTLTIDVVFAGNDEAAIIASIKERLALERYGDVTASDAHIDDLSSLVSPVERWENQQ